MPAAPSPTSPATEAKQDAIISAVDLQGPATDLEAITPSDSTPLSGIRALWIGGAGNLTVIIMDHEVQLVGIAAGTLLPIAGVTKVKAATTATNIVAFK